MREDSRFPWGYLVAALVPIGLICAIPILRETLGPSAFMAPAMLCSMAIGPVGAIVVGWGLLRLWRGDGERFPALPWLVWLPGLVGVAGFLLT